MSGFDPFGAAPSGAISYFGGPIAAHTPLHEEALTVTNFGAEAGDMTGWTTVLGAWAAEPEGGAGAELVPRTGTYAFAGGAVLESSAYD